MILQFQTDSFHNIQLLKDDKEQAVKDKEEAEKRAEKAEKDLHSLEQRRERLQLVMDNVSKEKGSRKAALWQSKNRAVGQNMIKCKR